MLFFPSLHSARLSVVCASWSCALAAQSIEESHLGIHLFGGAAAARLHLWTANAVGWDAGGAIGTAVDTAARALWQQLAESHRQRDSQAAGEQVSPAKYALINMLNNPFSFAELMRAISVERVWILEPSWAWIRHFERYLKDASLEQDVPSICTYILLYIINPDVCF